MNVTSTEPTTHEGVEPETIGYSSVDEAVNAILNRWTDADKPSEKEGGATSDANGTETVPSVDHEDNESDNEDEGADAEVLDGDDDEDESPEEADDDDASSDEEEEGEEDSKQPKVATDDLEVKVTVDGEEKTFTVKELRRLAGQEASLTRKSQEIAQARKAAEEQEARYVAGLQTLVQRAKERYEPYATVDFALAAVELTSEDYQALRKSATEAYEEYAFLTQQLDTHLQSKQAEHINTLRTQAQECVKALTDEKSPTYIKGWNQQVYDEVREFAVKQGLPPEEVNQIVNPSVIKIIHNAMLYERGKTVVTKKVAKAPKKVLRSETNTQVSKPKDPAKLAMSRLAAEGSKEAAVEALMARWATKQN